MPIVIERLGSSTTVTGQRARIVGVGDRLADRHLGQAGERDDLARARLLGRDPVERLGDQELGHARVLDLAVRAAPRDLLALLEDAVADAQQREPADVRRGVEVRDERLQRMRPGRTTVRGSSRAASSKSGARSSARADRVEARLPFAGDRVDDRELDLLARWRRGRGRARTPRSRPPRSARRGGRSCSRRARPGAAPRAPCAGRSASAAAAPRTRRPGAAHRRPSSARARPRRRSRRGPACR